MSEWLDIMLEEIRRKQRELDEARAERKRREQARKGATSDDDRQGAEPREPASSRTT